MIDVFPSLPTKFPPKIAPFVAARFASNYLKLIYVAHPFVTGI